MVKKGFLLKCPVGVLIFDEKGGIIEYKTFPKDPKEIAERLVKESPEERELRERLESKGFEISLKDQKINLDEIAAQIGFCKKAEFPALLAKINIEVTKLKVTNELASKDKLVIQAVRAQKHVDDTSNKFSELLREWYSIHFPELNGILLDNKQYASFILKVGNKERADEKLLSGFLAEKRFVKGILKIIPESIGSEVSGEDMGGMQKLAEEIIRLISLKEELVAYIEKTMEELTPNLAKVATALVGARLIEEAGSLKKLASMSSSTIQILGARTAMFRFLKTKKKPPKYGVIYQHPLVSSAPKKQKGKVARTLAGKISIAAKSDYGGGEYIAEKLLKDMNARIESLNREKG